MPRSAACKRCRHACGAGSRFGTRAVGGCCGHQRRLRCLSSGTLLDLRRPRDGMGGRKVGWYEPPHLIRGRRTTPSNWVTFQRCRRRQGGRGWLLSGAAFFGSCEEFPNDYTTAPRHREGTFCFSRLVFSPRAQRNPWVVGLGGMEREASAGGATPGSWNGGGRGGCKSHQSGVPW